MKRLIQIILLISFFDCSAQNNFKGQLIQYDDTLNKLVGIITFNNDNQIMTDTNGVFSINNIQNKNLNFTVKVLGFFPLSIKGIDFTKSDFIKIYCVRDYRYDGLDIKGISSGPYAVTNDKNGEEIMKAIREKNDVAMKHNEHELKKVKYRKDFVPYIILFLNDTQVLKKELYCNESDVTKMSPVLFKIEIKN